MKNPMKFENGEYREMTEVEVIQAIESERLQEEEITLEESCEIQDIENITENWLP